MGNPTDRPIDQLVKARWLAIGLSQTDLAEVLGAAFPQTQKDDSGPDGADARRLMQVAEELDIPLLSFIARAPTPGPKHQTNRPTGRAPCRRCRDCGCCGAFTDWGVTRQA